MARITMAFAFVSSHIWFFLYAQLMFSYRLFLHGQEYMIPEIFQELVVLVELSTILSLLNMEKEKKEREPIFWRIKLQVDKIC